MIKKAYAEAITNASAVMNKWLKPFSLSLSCEKENLRGDRLGEYEMGSIFEGEIKSRIDLKNIIASAKEDDLDQDEICRQIRLTIYHETGHGLMELLIDYAENYEEFQPLLGGDFGKKYFDIFNDDNTDEETIVEAFANCFEENKKSLLQLCVEETMNYLSNL